MAVRLDLEKGHWRRWVKYKKLSAIAGVRYLRGGRVAVPAAGSRSGKAKRDDGKHLRM
jgi:hypothetical protein